MRTTVTLDPETERLLREVMRQVYPMGVRTGYDPAHLGALGDDLEVDALLDLSPQ